MSTYLALKLNCFFGKNTSKGYAQKIKNFYIHFNNYEELIHQFEEIFIQDNYYFFTENSLPTIIDCGANIGLSVLYFKSLYPKARIIGFEPNPLAYRYLERNIQVNKLDQVTIYNKAIHNEEGFVNFYSDDNSLLSSVDPKRAKSSSKILVQTTKLSNFIEDQVDLVKIDVEGAEDCILEDLCESNKLIHVDQMIVEYHHYFKQNDYKLSKFLRILENQSFGYVLHTNQSLKPQKKDFQDILIHAYKIRKEMM